MRRHAICALVMLVAATVVAQAQTAERSYRFGEDGALHLTVPEAWQDSHRFVGSMEDSVGLAITYKSAEPEQWEILISAFWNVAEVRQNDPDERKAAVQKIAAGTLGKVKEQNIKIRPIAADPLLGYMFSVTDTEKRPGDFLYLTQGVAQVGQVLIAFSILSNGDHDAIEQQAVRMLRAARHTTK